jgi:hypothetical protein
MVVVNINTNASTRELISALSSINFIASALHILEESNLTNGKYFERNNKTERNVVCWLIQRVVYSSCFLFRLNISVEPFMVVVNINTNASTRELISALYNIIE